MDKTKILIAIISIFLGIVIITWLMNPSFEEISIGLKVLKEGEIAPDFTLPSVIDGSKFSLSDFRNSKYVLLYFWASWCPSCLEARPQIENLRKSIPHDRLEVLAINIGAGDSIESVRKFEKLHPISVPVLFDQGSKVSQSYGVRGVPFFVLIDPRGKIVYQGNELPDKDYLM